MLRTSLYFCPRNFSYLNTLSMSGFEIDMPVAGSPDAGTSSTSTVLTTQFTFEGFVARKSTRTRVAWGFIWNVRTLRMFPSSSRWEPLDPTQVIETTAATTASPIPRNVQNCLLTNFFEPNRPAVFRTAEGCRHYRKPL